jgi:hypothetical protein
MMAYALPARDRTTIEHQGPPLGGPFLIGFRSARCERDAFASRWCGCSHTLSEEFCHPQPPPVVGAPAVRCISMVAASPPVVLVAQAFCLNLAAASFDCACGYPRSVGGVAVVEASPLVVFEAQSFTVRLSCASFDATLTALRYAQAAAGGDAAAS